MADKPKILDWIAEAEHVVTLPEPIKKVYDEKLVAWFDILGMREKMHASDDADEILSIMGNLQQFVENACESLVARNKVDYLQISDGFILIAELDCINEICKILCTVQWQVLIYLRMLLRGAITAGKVSISDDSRLIVGPAFIDAFILESENAIFPRILFANEIYKYINKDNIEFEYIKEDVDKFLYLDFLDSEISSENYTGKQLNHLFLTRGVKEFLRDSYVNYEANKKKLAQKYGWTIAKLKAHNIKIL
jgi:hypothetical protein